MTVRFLAAAVAPERPAFVEKVHLDSPVASETVGNAPPLSEPPVRRAVVDRGQRPSPASTKASLENQNSDLPAPSAASEAPLPAAAALSLPPAPAYLAAGRLDPGPRPLQDIDPVYPDAAGMRSGSVVLRLLINESGEVDNAAVVRSSPQDLFDASALAAFGSARFSPGRVLGVPVKSQITIEVEFTPINRGSAVSGRNY